MINATPNLNGNSGKDFVAASYQLTAAIESMRDAMRNINCNVLHGRNYQTVVQAELARESDAGQFLVLSDQLNGFERFALAIGKQGIES